MDKIQELYSEWRKLTEEAIKSSNGYINGSVDCKNGSVREDFSEYLRDKDIYFYNENNEIINISYEDMLRLENKYNQQNVL